ncbi:MAG: aldehyde dehydrogenase family protein [Gammaproteobacteria bacterium]|nr:aldehyde dehydrogenase family protein [Gammaproteobacteria bacterium]MDH5302875.1 aldehyde dehydrogenase family protein [Gammaproteobacteria bacterium]MDH5320980.1 aldehyde dehydrogenase family protein [Gammaproteobacteria bacterium]
MAEHKDLKAEDRAVVDDMVGRARLAMDAIREFDQRRVDRLCQALGWATANETTFTRLAQMGVDESGLGDRAGRPGKRFKIMGVLRDALRLPSIGVIEEIPEKGIVKYAKPAGVIASLVPTTNPALTPPFTGIYALKCLDAVIFSPHPRSKNTTLATVEVMRKTMVREGVPADVFQCVRTPNVPMTQYLMSQCDLTFATGGQPMVRAAYSSGKPAYGVGAGNSTMVIDETAEPEIAARNTRLSKTSDFGSGCSADGNLLIDDRIYDRMLAALQEEGGYLVNKSEAHAIERVIWDVHGHRLPDSVACTPQRIGELAGLKIPDDRTFVIVENDRIGPEHNYSKEKLTTLLAVYRYHGFEQALQMVRQIYEVGGKGHSCGIYSHNDDHIDQLARVAPVSRMMVRQPQSKANAGAFNNGMPMTSSLGCGIWGGNITNENVHLKHFMNVTWVSRPIAEDRPSEQELFGDFYGTETD